MKPTEKNERSASKAESDQSRREALKRFGKLAAAAPAVMVLLQSRRSLAVVLPPPPEAYL